MLLLIILLILVFGGGGFGYYGQRQGWYGGTGFGGIIGLVLVVAVLLWLFGRRGFGL